MIKGPLLEAFYGYFSQATLDLKELNLTCKIGLDVFASRILEKLIVDVAIQEDQRGDLAKVVLLVDAVGDEIGETKNLFDRLSEPAVHG